MNFATHRSHLRICLYLSLTGMFLPCMAFVFEDYRFTQWGQGFLAVAVVLGLIVCRGKRLRLHSINVALSKDCGIVLEPPGVVGDAPAWVWLGPGPYLYAHYTLPGLLWMVLTGWKKDRHLVG